MQKIYTAEYNCYFFEKETTLHIRAGLKNTFLDKTAQKNIGQFLLYL